MRHAQTIPLAALRPALDLGWADDARWLPEVLVRGAPCAALEQPLDALVAFRVRAGARCRLRAWVSLADAAPGSRARARVSVRHADGREIEVWSAPIGGAWRAPARWRRVDAPLGAHADDVDLILAATPTGAADGSAKARWAGAAIEGPAAAALPALPPAPAAIAPLRSDPSRRPVSDAPLISVLTPVHDPDPAILAETLACVRRQTFHNWELCLVDDGSRDPRVMEMLRRCAAQDDRVRLTRHERAQGIARATNAALALATGDYVALLDHDDVLVDDALAAVTAAIAEHPDADMIYSDEDLIEDDRRVWLYLKPDWSPDLLRSCMFTCHLGVYRRSLMVETGGFRPAFDGGQDYDFVLRFTERTDRIVHVPRVLYRWRVHDGSTSGNADAKPSGYPAARRAIAEHVGRAGIDAEVHFGATRGEYRVRHRVDPAAAVALILPVTRADAAFVKGLERAIDSWVDDAYTAWQLVLAGPTDALAALPRAERVRTVETRAAGRAVLLNRGIEATDAPHLVLLDTPVEALTRDWLARLVGFASLDGVGATAAKTVAADGRIEHAGVVLEDGLPLAVLHGADASEPGPLGVARAPSNFSAVSGAVATRREILDRAGGLDEALDELAGIDLCLRLRELGMRIVSVPDALVRCPAGFPPVNALDELAAFRRRWRDRVPSDPYFNPGYHRHRADFVARPGV